MILFPFISFCLIAPNVLSKFPTVCIPFLGLDFGRELAKDLLASLMASFRNTRSTIDMSLVGNGHAIRPLSKYLNYPSMLSILDSWHKRLASILDFQTALSMSFRVRSRQEKNRGLLTLRPTR